MTEATGTRQAWKQGAVFRGIADRPYDQAILHLVAWPGVSTRAVHFSQLWLTQNRLRVPALFGLERYSSDPHPRVVVFAGEFFLEDGHHRVVRLALRGATNAIMRVVLAEDLAQTYEHSR